MNPETDRQFENSPNPFIVPFSIIIAGALIGAGVYFSGVAKNSEIQLPNEAVIGTVNIKPVNSEDHILGNPSAKVIIVEYSDPECPFCKQFHQTMVRIMDEYGKDGNVAWVYRQLPIAGLHKKAPYEAQATECAAQVGGNAKFWEYTTALYNRTESNDSFNPDDLPKLAKEMNIDESEFTKCLTSGETKSKVDDDIRDATAAGFEATPMSVLVTRSGQKVTIEGAQSYATMKSIIDIALAQETVGQ